VRDTIEQQGEDDHRDQRLPDDPQRAENGLAIPDFEVAPDEDAEELAVGPDFAQVKRAPSRGTDE